MLHEACQFALRSVVRLRLQDVGLFSLNDVNFVCLAHSWCSIGLVGRTAVSHRRGCQSPPGLSVLFLHVLPMLHGS